MSKKEPGHCWGNYDPEEESCKICLISGECEIETQNNGKKNDGIENRGDDGDSSED